MSRSGPPGAQADRPSDIPSGGWWQITRRAWTEAKADQVPLLAAGVAFYAFLSLFPAVIALISLYGLLADPADVAAQVDSVAAALPQQAQELLTNQMESLAARPQESLGIGLAVSLALALWSASGGTGNMITAVNLAYDEDETRGFVRRKALALLLTLGAIVFVVVAVALVAVAPAVLSALELPTAVRVLVEVVRWLVLLVAISGALAVLYRLAPDRDNPRLRWVSVGAAVASVLWLLGSVGFSLYVDMFGSYAQTYGSLAGVVVLLLWLWLTCYAVLLGAEINAETEEQTARDTTVGPEQPIGRRDAVKADSVPGEPS